MSDINVLRKTVEDLRRREQQLLKDKEQSEIEFGKKRAKFKELYMAREGEGTGIGGCAFGFFVIIVVELIQAVEV